MSLASASRLVSVKDLMLAMPPPVSAQFEVPVVMPKVWLPKRPLVVAAKICTMPFWLPKTSEPSPHPAVPYLSAAMAADVRHRTPATRRSLRMYPSARVHDEYGHSRVPLQGP